MAIAFDSGTGTNSGSDVSPFTLAFTNTAGDILFVAVWLNDATQTISGVTYNAVSMTQIDTISLSGIGISYLFMLVTPATGNHNIVVTHTGTPNLVINVASYSGSKQSGQPDAHQTNTSASQTSTAVPLTTVADNCWIVCCCYDDNLNILSAGTNAFQRESGGASNEFKLFDTNGAQTPAGAKTMTITRASASVLKSLICSFAPAAADTITAQCLC